MTLLQVELTMTPAELAAWMRGHGYLDDLGRLGSTKLSGDLGRHRSTVLKMLTGELPIKQETVLALEALDHRWREQKAATPKRRRA